MNGYRPDLSNVRLAPAFAIDLARAHVDGEFRRIQADLFREHRRQERLKHCDLKYQIVERYRRDREDVYRRYNRRMHSIDQKQERMAARLRRDHNSIGGRLAALTQKGRDRQQQQWHTLWRRAVVIRAETVRRFDDRRHALLDRHEADRKAIAHEIKSLRQQHRSERMRRVLVNDLDRDDRIQAYARQIREQRAEQARQQEFERTIGEERQRTRATQ